MSPVRPAQAATEDVPALRTATGLVVLAQAAYRSLQAVPTGGGDRADPVIRDLVTGAGASLETARAALADATTDAGGVPQSQPDPTYAALVDRALPTVRSAADVVALALTVEDVLGQTLAADAAGLSTPALRALALAPAADSAARKATLLIVNSLLSSGRADLIAAPPDLAALPGNVGTVGFPDTRFPTTKALAPGAVGAG